LKHEKVQKKYKIIYDEIILYFPSFYIYDILVKDVIQSYLGNSAKFPSIFLTSRRKCGDRITKYENGY